MAKDYSQVRAAVGGERPHLHGADHHAEQMEEDIARQRVEEQLAKASAQGRQNALCASFREEASPSPNQGVEAGLEPFSADFCRTKEKAG